MEKVKEKQDRLFKSRIAEMCNMSLNTLNKRMGVIFDNGGLTTVTREQWQTSRHFKIAIVNEIIENIW